MSAARKKRRARYLAVRANPLGSLSHALRLQVHAEPRPADTDAARRFRALARVPGFFEVTKP